MAQNWHPLCRHGPAKAACPLSYGAPLALQTRPSFCLWLVQMSLFIVGNGLCGKRQAPHIHFGFCAKIMLPVLFILLFCFCFTLLFYLSE